LWKLVKQGKKSAVLEIEPVTKLPARARSSISAEAGRLLTFAAASSATTEIKFLK
jgi:hypothetical protein